MKHYYTLLYRPPSFASLPPGWELVARPALVPNNYERRTDLPVSPHQHGTIAYTRELTAAEIDSYQLQRVG